MIFWRIVDNKVLPIGEVDTLGFEESEGMRIPDEYLNDQEFVIMRGCHGIGDYGIISAMPRLLKTKYPDCKVFIPSDIFIERLFGVKHRNAYVTFKDNPYVDGFIDNIKGDIFHDQYRLYDKNNPNIPLLEQMLKFWQFNENEYADSQPELYWSKDEIELGNFIIDKYTDGDFGCLLISNRFGTQKGKYDQESHDRDTYNISKILKQNNLPYFYWSYTPLKDTPFNFIKKALDMRHIDIRVQLYIKSKAKLNLSNQCGMNHMVVRYSKCYESQRQFPISHNFVKGEVYI